MFRPSWQNFGIFWLSQTNFDMLRLSRPNFGTFQTSRPNKKAFDFVRTSSEMLQLFWTKNRYVSTFATNIFKKNLFAPPRIDLFWNSRSTMGMFRLSRQRKNFLALLSRLWLTSNCSKCFFGHTGKTHLVFMFILSFRVEILFFFDSTFINFNSNQIAQIGR